MDNYAPVLIPTLNRYEHFRRCIESLLRCTHADKTNIYVAFDYPLNDSHREGFNKIDGFLSKIKGFKSIEVIRRKKNLGAYKNIGESIRFIFENYDRMIFSEDDNEFSPNFLDYINKGLEKFKNDKNVSAVCGYNYPVSIPKSYKSNFFFHPEISAWGYGAWKKKWENRIYGLEDLKNFISNPLLKRKLKFYSSRHISTIKQKIIKKERVYGDLAYFLKNIENDTYSVFPVISKVRNHGHDGSGVHCGTLPLKNKFRSQVIDEELFFNFYNNVQLNDRIIIKSLRKYFSIKLRAKIKINFNYIISK